MTPREFNERLLKRARRAGVTVDASLADRLSAYYRLLESWNQKINLTAFNLAGAPDEAIDRLLVEPLVASRHLAGSHAHPHFVVGPHPQMLDIGSGGGSPAIPLKLALPNVRLLMVESKTRKSAFLREAIRQLGIEGADVLTARAEELLARPELHESQDFVTVRAVRTEQKLMVRLQAFLRLGGRIMLFRAAGGSESPPMVTPPLVYEATVPLVESFRSRLVVLRRML
ncbi:MAG: 16S rRNA (guanine(527)-N(7))-methyltransferase RsmG [Acidobacteriota bacterium]